MSLLLPALATVMRMRRKMPTVQMTATGSTTVTNKAGNRRTALERKRGQEEGVTEQ